MPSARDVRPDKWSDITVLFDDGDCPRIRKPESKEEPQNQKTESALRLLGLRLYSKLVFDGLQTKPPAKATLLGRELEFRIKNSS